jgi:hypothetical protein
MSSNIWTQCAGASRLAPLACSPWRVVEGQYQVATRKLVDSLEEHAILERLIESSKPPRRAAPSLHVLLATPFRYPPLRHGSRFARRHEASLWYGSTTERTAFAELAYYRLVFIDGTSADLGGVATWHTAFRSAIRTARGVDLMKAPFLGHRDVIASPSEYGPAQVLGSAMRQAGVEGFLFPSARDRQGGVNVGVFTPTAFDDTGPFDFQTWHCTASHQRIDCVRRDFGGTAAFSFSRDEFLVDGRLPAPAL